jgi:hypothetical protein
VECRCCEARAELGQQTGHAFVGRGDASTGRRDEASARHRRGRCDRTRECAAVRVSEPEPAPDPGRDFLSGVECAAMVGGSAREWIAPGQVAPGLALRRLPGRARRRRGCRAHRRPATPRWTKPGERPANGTGAVETGSVGLLVRNSRSFTVR